MLAYKASVRKREQSAAITAIERAVLAVQRASPADCPDPIVVTSINDSSHAPTSRHYTDEAVDLRVHSFPSRSSILRFRAALESALGAQFRVLYESPSTPHAHLHVQVRRGLTYP